MRFKSLEMSADELVFGYSKHPLRYGTGLEVGVGKVIPEIKYFPSFEEGVRFRNNGPAVGDGADIHRDHAAKTCRRDN